MAKVSTGPTITDIRNKAGNVVFYRSREGAATRAFVMPAEPGTTRQLETQDAHAAALLRWQTGLTDNQRMAWESFAHRFPNTTSINATKPLSGCGAFIQVNLYTYMYGAGNIDDPPIDQNVTQPEDLILTSNNFTRVAVDNFDRANGNDLGAGWYVNPANSFQIFSHQVGPNAAVWGMAAEWTTPADINQLARAKLTKFPGVNQYIGPAVRTTPATITGYTARIDPDIVLLVRMLNGTGTGIGTWPHTPVLNAIYELEVNAHNLTVRENGATIIGPIEDTNINSGLPGLVALVGGTNLLLDNWLGRDLSAAEPLTISLATPGAAGQEVLVVRATPPLSAGITNCGRHYRNIAAYDCPVSFPLDIFWDWHNKLWFDHDTQTYYQPDLTTGKRIGVEAYFVRKANGAPSGRLCASSITT